MEYQKIENSMVSIATEMFRFQRVFEKAISKLDITEQSKYMSQYGWFSKRVYKALEEADLRVLSLDGQIYDPGMAATPLNIDEFEVDDPLYVVQTLEPIIMQDGRVVKTGTIVLGKVEA